MDAGLYRKNVGIAILNSKNLLLACKRIGMQNAWQMPQGGVDDNENLQNAMYRELKEEVGLEKSDVEVMEIMKEELYYKFSNKNGGKYIGQRQTWFLLKLKCNESKINIIQQNQEFDDYKWVNKEFLLENIIEFKKEVYLKVLNWIENILNNTK